MSAHCDHCRLAAGIAKTLVEIRDLLTSPGDTGEGNGAPGSVTAGSGAPVTRAEFDDLRAQLARLGERVERIGGAR